jgi:hypothetical protein
MTETQWLASADPRAMLGCRWYKWSIRKLRLFTAAWHRRQVDPPDPDALEAIGRAESLAEQRKALAADLRVAHMDGRTARLAAREAVWDPSAACADQAALLRDIFGNPFRPATVDEAWLTPAVVSLASDIYEDRTFDRLPELADALVAAGCGNVELLAHLRSDGPHVRGCWALDLMLGKA